MINWDKRDRSIKVSKGWAPSSLRVWMTDGDRTRTIHPDSIRGCTIDRLIVEDDDVYEEFIHSEVGHQIMPCLRTFGEIEFIHKNYIKFKLKKLKFI